MTIHYSDEQVTVHAGDCLDVLRELDDNSIDACVTDPPYNLSFMSKAWDGYDGREDAGFGYWLAGLIDGEGCFTIKSHARGTHAPSFAIKLRADDSAVLEHAHRTLGIGTIRREKRDASNDMVTWTVGDNAGCQRLVDLLDKYQLRAKKRIDYWAWREAVCEWIGRGRGNRWHGSVNNEQMAGLRDRLMTTRAYCEVAWSGNEFQDWCRLWAAECLRVLKPGGHIAAFGGTRTWHRLAVAIEDAGFEIRDNLAWICGSGFPKSLDVSKAIDKAAGAERDRELPQRRARPSDAIHPTAPAAKRWQGWGTALKPAFEPIILARKPIRGTVASNVVEHGTGALNIDGCRVDATDKAKFPAGVVSTTGAVYGGGAGLHVDRPRGEDPNPAGRWPANVLLDPAAADELDRQSGVSVSSSGRNGNDAASATYGLNRKRNDVRGHDDEGGASRFFPIFRYTAKAPGTERPTVDGIVHPTVKPLELMRWLVRLITPPGGTVLDPFAGTGTTAEAAIHEHKRAIVIEREPTYLPLIVARLSKPMAVGFDFESEGA